MDDFPAPNIPVPTPPPPGRISGTSGVLRTHAALGRQCASRVLGSGRPGFNLGPPVGDLGLVISFGPDLISFFFPMERIGRTIFSGKSQ